MSVTKNDISTKIFTSNVAYGSDRGQDYSLVGSLECTVKGITLYGGKSFGRMIVEKFDGTSITVGDKHTNPPESPPVVWKFNREDRLGKIELYSNGIVLAGIRLCVKGQARPLEAAIDGYTLPPIKSEQMQVIETGSGKMIGVFGNSNNDLQSLGFAMLKH